MFEQLLDFFMTTFAPYQVLNKNTKDWRNKLVIMQNYLTLYANRADYKGFPESFMKLMGKNRMWLYYLFFAPCVVWFEHPAYGLICLPASSSGEATLSGIPDKWIAYSADGRTWKLDSEDCVVMFNDYSYSIPFIKLLYNTEFMLEADKTHRQNLKAQRQPLIMEIEEDEKKSANEFMAKLDNEVVVVRKRMKAGSSKRPTDMPYDTKAFESGRKFEGDNLASDYRYFDNRNLSMLGYNNENLEKKERLLVDEVNSNNEVVDSFYTVALECQKEAFEAINKKFGTNIQIIPRKLKNFSKENENGKLSSSVQQGQTTEKSAL